jgi:hypothetical protein
MKAIPDASKRHNPDPVYLRKLVADSGYSASKCARLLGVDRRLFARYLQIDRGEGSAVCRYSVQFALEALAGR